MEKGKKIPPQEASQTNPVAKPEDTKGGQKLYVLSGVLKLLPLQGDSFASVITQGDALG